MDSLLPGKTLAGLLAATTATVAVAVLANFSLRAHRQHTERIQNRMEVLASVDQVLSNLVDAETGERGYLLTGDEAYLQPFVSGRREIFLALAQLSKTVESEPAQLQMVHEVEALVRRIVEDLQAGIDSRRNGSLQTAVSIVLGGEGKRLMDQARLLLAELRVLELKRLRSGQQLWRDADVDLTLVIWGGSGLLLLLVLGAGWAARRDFLSSQRVLQFQNRLTGIVGHDLRSPLSAITTSAGLLLRSPDLSEPRRKTVARILGSARRMERLIRDLLDYTRARVGGGISLSVGPVDLNAICDRVLAELQLENPERRVVRQVDRSAVGEWDQGRVEQIVSNLVSNALKYSPRESEVRVNTRSTQGSAALEVFNEGRPIPRNLLLHIFEPSQQGDERDQQSVGLGLFIVHQLVDAHGGQVEVHSSESEGTLFTVTLPKRIPAFEGEPERGSS